MADWYKIEVNEVMRSLDSDPERGLEDAQALQRFSEQGPNELVESGLRSPWSILWEQLTATMVLILLAAALVSGLLGELKDAIAIGAIVILFAVLGFIQEYRAERAMAALKRIATPLVRVLRQGNLQERSARELVPGDVILLEAGNLTPADARLVESVNLRIQEAALTGESEPVEKSSQALPSPDRPLGDRRNMAYMGSVVTYGRGKAVVVETGMRTELGKIASMLQSVAREQTPLQRRLDQLGKLLAVVGLLVAGAVFLMGLWIDEPLRDILLTSVSIAVAIVPEGLPAVVTITLALGAQRMLKRQALIRKLPAVETLGSVTVICSDKTGTLTENRMTVMILDVAGRSLDLSEDLRAGMPSLAAQTGEPAPAGAAQDAPLSPAMRLLLASGALCNDASLVVSGDSPRYRTIGDPTEAALLIAAARFALLKDDLQAAAPRLAEAPFDSERKRMTTIHGLSPQGLAGLLGIEGAGLADQAVAFTKGAVDGLLDICERVWVDGKLESLDAGWRARVQAANDRLAQQGMRVLGLAFRPLDELPPADRPDLLEKDLVLIGLVGMMDPPRPEVKAAVETCKLAGIRPVMITGDHPLTAWHIALELGIAPPAEAPQGHLLTGQELGSLSDAELGQVVRDVSVFARVSPEHKLRIVQALQAQGQVVAMTGDGVNDAPALKQANIGVAMGITGTDVSKEASEMVLQDDNFATIVAAVEEGRTIYDNLRKFIKYSVAGNIGKVSVMLLAPALGKPLPLEPLQLLWLNLLTDGLLGLGLGLEPPEKDAMKRPPYSPKQGIFSQGLGWQILWTGALIGSLALGVGYTYWRIDPGGYWQTMTFSTLAFAQLAQALASRSQKQTLFELGLRSNRPGMLLAVLVFALQMLVIYIPGLQSFLHTEPLSPGDLAISLAAGSLVFFAIEAEKLLARRRERTTTTEAKA
ncbi:MAG: cation-translocating P-type ATPase [Anaerolineales bacterium]|nr:cation-translocating P-type ATPase [Anaerolineales bacterium]